MIGAIGGARGAAGPAGANGANGGAMEFSSVVSPWEATKRVFPLGQTNATQLSTVTPAINTLWAWPFMLARDGVIDQLSIHVSVGGASGRTRFGIYANNPLTDGPGVLLFGCPATLITDINNTVHNVAVPNLALSGGVRYWAAIHNNNAAPTMHALPQNGQNPGIIGLSQSTFNITNPFTHIRLAHAFGTGEMPNPWPAGLCSAVTAQVPIIAARFI